ncbi:hypothetical protein JNB_11649 [Janibacter sp. HTCC2649]|nr:hypothetical protein JNB_11649 [Janibacter sp. HTCC2649]
MGFGGFFVAPGADPDFPGADSEVVGLGWVVELDDVDGAVRAVGWPGVDALTPADVDVPLGPSVTTATFGDVVGTGAEVEGVGSSVELAAGSAVGASSSWPSPDVTCTPVGP